MLTLRTKGLHIKTKSGPSIVLAASGERTFTNDMGYVLVGPADKNKDVEVVSQMCHMVCLE